MRVRSRPAAGAGRGVREGLDIHLVVDNGSLAARADATSRGQPPEWRFVDAVVVCEVARPAAVRPRTVALSPGRARA